MSERATDNLGATGFIAALRGSTALRHIGGRATLATALVLCAVGSAHAQEAPEKAVRAAPISVTATRTPMKAFDVPGQVTVMGAEEIADEIPASLGDLFDGVPGVTSVGGPRRTGEVPSIRGFSGADVIVTIDGARQNFVSGHDGRVFVDPAFLGEVELVRGASSSLYGSGGTGGIVALRTIKPSDLLKGDETLGVQTGLSYRSGNDEFTQRLIGVARPNDMTDLSGGIVRRRSYDTRLGNGSDLPGEDKILSGFLKGEFRTESGAGVRLGWQRFSNEAEEPNNGQAASAILADKDVDSETFSGGFFFKPEGNPYLDADVQFYSSKSTVDETNQTGSSANVLQERDLNSFGFNASNTSRFAITDSIDVAVTGGMDFFRDSGSGAANGAVRGGVVTGDQEVYGFFLQTAFNFYDVFGLEGSELSVTPGARYDRFDSEDSSGNKTGDNRLSPKISARFAPVPWGFVYGSYAEDFRAPTLDELFPSGTHFPVITGGGAFVGSNTFISNLTLKPQSTDTWEFGAGLEFENLLSEGDSFQTKAGYYQTDGENFLSTQVTQTADLTNPQFFAAPFLVGGFTCRAFISITVDPDGCGGTTQIVNVAKAELSGVELEATYDASRWRAQMAAQTMETEDKATGNPIGVEQPDQVTLDLRFKLPEVDSFVGWQGTFAEKFNEGTVIANHRDGYQLHEIYARWRPEDGMLSGFSVGVTAENLFDEEYQRVSSDTMEEGRSVLVDVSYALTW